MRRRREHLAWLATAAGAVAVVSPWVKGVSWPKLTMIRSLMPWAALSAIPLALRAALTGHRRLAVTSAVVGMAGAAVSAPLVVPRRQPPVDPGAGAVTIVHANLMYGNRRIDRIPDAIAALDPDVVTFSELTAVHARRLRASRLADRYPHRIERPRPGAGGTGLWSRYPVVERSTTNTTHHSVGADIDGPGGVVRVIVVHTQSPIARHGEWQADLATLGALIVAPPAVMTGDFNASWWHPELRRLLQRGGWRDCHIERGHGLSCSWPTERWHAVFRWHPPFVRLDHALVNDGLAVVAITDFDIPGSDHRGLMVTVQRAAPRVP